ncbi:MAG: class I SAM-dependent methyltransferase family protein [Candidatus Thermoplasmatota archaeon]
MQETMLSRCVLVPKREGERARKYLSERGILRTDLRICHRNGYLLIPIVEGAEVPYKTTEAELEWSKRRPRDYKEFLELPEGLIPLLPRSYDVVGDVAIIRLREELKAHEAMIGEALLQAHRHLRTIAVDAGVHGDARHRSLRVVAGRQSTLTLHREHGVRLWVDPSRAYFSPRLAGERMRIARLVTEGERVIDMFAGVGPFSIIIARHSFPSGVDAIDSNPEAVELMKRNIALNKVAVHPHLGDARKVMLELGKADRIIMNLPHTAHSYLDAALRSANPKTMVHLYQHVTKGEMSTRGEQVLEMCKGLGVNAEMHHFHALHPYSPRSEIVVYDISVLGAL